MDTLTLPPPLLVRPDRSSRPMDSSPDIRRDRRPAVFDASVAALIFCTAVLGALGAALLLRSGTTADPERYRTETVTRGQVTGVLTVPARVVPRSVVRVGSERVGRMVTVAVAPGDAVKRGQVLARLDDRELRAQADGAHASAFAAEVNARQAQLQLAQIVYLLHHGGSALDAEGAPVGRQTLRAAAAEAEVSLVTAAAELKKQLAAVTASRASLATTVLTAPIDGVVLSRAIEPGETVAAGAPLFVIAADPSELQVVAAVDEGDVARLQPGQATFVVPGVPDRVFDASIRMIEPGALDQDGAGAGAGPIRYHVRLRANNEQQQLRPGMSAMVSLPLSSTRQALHVPVEALRFSSESDGGDSHSAIYVLDRGKSPRRIPVQLGVSDGRHVEVRAAILEPGAAVILGRKGAD
jgi:HlyD family secretion protein